MLQDPVRLTHHCKLKGYWFASSPFRHVLVVFLGARVMRLCQGKG